MNKIFREIEIWDLLIRVRKESHYIGFTIEKGCNQNTGKWKGVGM